MIDEILERLITEDEIEVLRKGTIEEAYFVYRRLIDRLRNKLAYEKLKGNTASLLNGRLEELGIVYIKPKKGTILKTKTSKALQSEAVKSKVDNTNRILIDRLDKRIFNRMNIISGVRKANPIRFNDIYLVNGEYWQAKIWRDGKYKAIGKLHKDKEKAALEAVELKEALGIVTNPYKEAEILFEQLKKDRFNAKELAQLNKMSQEEIDKRKRQYIRENTIQIDDAVTLFENVFRFVARKFKADRYEKMSLRVSNEEWQEDQKNYLITGAHHQVNIYVDGKNYKSNLLPDYHTARKAKLFMLEYLQGVKENGSESIQSREH